MAGIVFDLLDLFHSAQRPGSYFLLNCACGYPPDAGIEEMVLVSHPDANTVIWELDVRGPRQLSVFKIAGFTIQ